jgi:hypothetical protein
VRFSFDENNLDCRRDRFPDSIQNAPLPQAWNAGTVPPSLPFADDPEAVLPVLVQGDRRSRRDYKSAAARN